MRATAVALLPVLALSPVTARAADATFVLRHVTVIDVENGQRLADQAVVLTEKRIASLGPDARTKLPKAARVIEARGQFLIPGLWDMHVHTLPQPNRPHALEIFLPLFIANGLTGVRDMGSVPDALPAARARIAKEHLLSPRLVAAGPIVDGSKPLVPPVSITASTPEDGRRVMASLRSAGADFVKVYSALSRDVYFAIAESARTARLPFVGHVPFSIAVAEASDAGQRSVEHLLEINLTCSTEEDAIRSELIAAVDAPDRTLASITIARQAARARASRTQDPDKCQALHARLVKNGTWVVPTLAVSYNANDATRGEDPRLRYFEAATRATWQGDTRRQQPRARPANTPLQALAAGGALRTVKDLSQAGVPLLAGTDLANFYTFPGFDLHLELELLVAAGLTPLQALQAATLNPARFLNTTETLGTVAQGKLADLVLLAADPLLDVRNTTRIRAVIADSRLFTRADLDALLASVERVASEQQR